MSARPPIACRKSPYRRLPVPRRPRMCGVRASAGGPSQDGPPPAEKRRAATPAAHCSRECRVHRCVSPRRGRLDNAPPALCRRRGCFERRGARSGVHGIVRVDRASIRGNRRSAPPRTSQRAKRDPEAKDRDGGHGRRVRRQGRARPRSMGRPPGRHQCACPALSTAVCRAMRRSHASEQCVGVIRRSNTSEQHVGAMRCPVRRPASVEGADRRAGRRMRCVVSGRWHAAGSKQQAAGSNQKWARMTAPSPGHEPRCSRLRGNRPKSRPLRSGFRRCLKFADESTDKHPTRHTSNPMHRVATVALE
jgi:hypothetical protein